MTVSCAHDCASWSYLGNRCWCWKRDCGTPGQKKWYGTSFQSIVKHSHSGHVISFGLWIGKITAIIYQAASGEKRPASALALAESPLRSYQPRSPTDSMLRATPSLASIREITVLYTRKTYSLDRLQSDLSLHRMHKCELRRRVQHALLYLRPRGARIDEDDWRLWPVL